MKTFIRRCVAIAISALWPLLALAAPGDLDPSFGTNGRVAVPYPDCPGASLYPCTMLAPQAARLPDGRVVVAWQKVQTIHAANSSEVVVLAFDANGARVPYGYPGETEAHPAPPVSWGATFLGAIAPQADGALVVALRRFTGQPSGALAVQVRRLTPTGEQDPGFGGVFSPPADLSINSVDDIALLADGSSLVAVTYTEGNVAGGLGIVKFLPTGAPDGFYGTNGIAKSALVKARVGTPAVLAVNSDGSAYLGGTTGDPNAGGTNFVVMRFSVGGTQDFVFNNTTGYLNVPSGDALTFLYDAVAQSDGSVLLAGESGSSGALARVLPNGTLDPAFAGGGRITFANPYLRSVALEPDGRIVVSGAAVWRFLANGTRDATLGGAAAIPGSVPQGSLSLLPGGRIVTLRGAELSRFFGEDKPYDLFTYSRLFAMQQYRDFLGREGDANGVDFWSGQLDSGATTRGQLIDTFFVSPEFQGTIAPVARLYFAYFMRIPDYAGLTFWVDYYKSSTLEGISNQFAASGEFQSTYGSLDNGQFVDLVYQNVLGRAPDPGGRAHWKGQLDGNTTSRGQVMLQFSESAEYRGLINAEVYVTMTYMGMLRRGPDASGFSYWVQYIDGGNSGLALIDQFLASPEYRARFLP